MLEPGTYRCPACGQRIVIYIRVESLSCGRDHVKAVAMLREEDVEIEV